MRERTNERAYDVCVQLCARVLYTRVHVVVERGEEEEGILASKQESLLSLLVDHAAIDYKEHKHKQDFAESGGGVDDKRRPV